MSQSNVLIRLSALQAARWQITAVIDDGSNLGVEGLSPRRNSRVSISQMHRFVRQVNIFAALGSHRAV
jgi:hypothetical protein